jgi:hypothetical protein
MDIDNRRLFRIKNRIEFIARHNAGKPALHRCFKKEGH